MGFLTPYCERSLGSTFVSTTSISASVASSMDVFMGLSASHCERFLGSTVYSQDLCKKSYHDSSIVPYCQLINGCNWATTWWVRPTWVIHEVSSSRHGPGVYSQPACLSDHCTTVHTSNVSMREYPSAINICLLVLAV